MAHKQSYLRHVQWLLILGLVHVVAGIAVAFPENIRDGYVNCTACHVSPTGGGTLTAYGRSLSSELMSTWSYKGEEGVFHYGNPEKWPEWLMVGGDIRNIQTWTSTQNEDVAQWISMQWDAEAAIKYKKFTVDSTFGYVERPDEQNWIGSRRYYLMYNVTDEWTVRAGRFYPQFGIMVADHYLPTRRGIGFDETDETNNVEVAWVGENWNFYATGSQEPGEVAPSSRESAVSFDVERAIGDSSKIGISGWSGHSDILSRQMASLHGMFGFTNRLFLLSEFDPEWSNVKSSSQALQSFFAFNRLGYELHKGIIAFLQEDYAQTNMQDGTTASDDFGVGLQFFPRPHFEFQGLWEKSRVRAVGDYFSDYAFLLLHYYL